MRPIKKRGTATEKSLAKENAFLRNEIKRRMTELEYKARELEIEASLEKVRAIAMAMKEPADMLAVCKTISLELKSLGVTEIRNVQTAIVYQHRGTYLNYEFYAKHNRQFTTEVDYTNHPMQKAFIKQMLSGPNGFFKRSLKGKKVQDWYNFQKTTNQFADKYLAKATSLNYYWYSLGPVALGISSYEPLRKSEQDLFNRFRNVFALSYRRYLDIEKAEAQARESHIETALERVRAVAMAMRKPEDFMDISEVIYKQLIILGFDRIRNVQIAIENDDKHIYSGVEYSEHYQNRFNNVPYDASPLFREIADEMKRSSSAFYQKEIKGKEFKAWRKWRKTVEDEMDQGIHPELDAATSMCFYLHSVGTGMLGISTFEAINNEKIEILKRFKNVFELSYRRYIDIEKAEAQAKESQIELALERVRARAMGMQKSDELLDVIKVVAQQLLSLDFKIGAATFSLNYQETNDFDLWMAVPGSPDVSKIHVPYFDHPLFNNFIQAKESSADFLVQQLSFEEKNSYFDHFFKNTIGNSGEAEKWVYNSKGYAGSEVLMKSISLGIANLDAIPYTEEENAILKRFATAFEQSYTRFLDLQKAEAQAKEAQIEAALEKVRSHSLAMHNSSELGNVVTIVFEKLKELNVIADDASATIFTLTESSKDVMHWSMGPMGGAFNVLVPYTDHPMLTDFWQAKENGENFIARSYSDKIKKSFFEWALVHSGYKQLPGDVKKWILEAPGEGFGVSSAWLEHSGIFISTYTGRLLSENDNGILKRFVKVFEQSYIRFLDLQKAEAQAREAKIEAALEKVRSRSLSMHKSEEILAVVRAVFDRLNELNIELNTAFIITFKENSRDTEWWLINKDKGEYSRILVEYTDLAILKEMFETKEQGKEIFSATYQAEAKNQLFRYLFTQTDFKHAPPERQKFIFESDAVSISMAMTNKIAIQITRHHERSFSGEDNEILKRFTKVFDQSYTRFLDLQKAEAQAREGQIEAALERVRGKTMAMHVSTDVQDVIMEVANQFQRLGFKIDSANIDVNLDIHRDPDMHLWISVPGKEQYPAKIIIPYIDHPIFTRSYERLDKGEAFFVDTFSKKEKDSFFDHVFQHTILKYIPEERKQYIFSGKGMARSIAIAKHTALAIYNYDIIPYSDEENSILVRFSHVFDQAYTRFLDLQKAEAQAREAQIEAALERVRSKAMAMHQTDDFNSAVAVVFEELEKLNLGVLRCGISVLNKQKRCGNVWLTSATEQGHAIQVSGDESFDIHPLLHGAFEAWLRQEDFYYVLRGDDLNAYYRAVKEEQFELPESQFVSSVNGEKEQHCFVAVYHGGGLFAFQDTAFSDEAKKVMKRFASVFDLTYKRFLDLQKAEANAREATIEAALERVRARAMAMHNSNDVSATASMVFTELRKLGIKPIRCGVGLLNNESLKAPLYSATSSPQGDSLSLVGWVMLSGHPVLEKIYQSWQQQEDYFPVLTGEQLRSYYELLLAGLSVNIPDWKDGQIQYGNFFSFSIGCLYAWSDVPYNSEEIKILKRFAGIIDLTFRRYMELQQSELNAKEAVKQAALDRIRADIASMRTVSDLDRITPLIWNELSILGIPFIRCGVFIMDDAQQVTHTFLATPEGKAIAAFHLPYDATELTAEVINHWRRNENYIDHWTEPQYIVMADTLVKLGAIATREQYIHALPTEGFYLHFFPFLQGMLYVGNTIRFGEEEMKLIHSVADAFSTAYARYEDFNKLEAAKRQVDNTLVDLKQAQQLLVQSEKMASLGELTAGIAHEIQNPLNFVNNFSEVNTELISEMLEEVKKGNIEDAEAIADDIKKNLEKINHHGKRADSIVKGMLQHSRTSSGQKELTDINALADEYLRLAYHGLRAKDKSFNAKFETDFDNTIDKINIIPQDVGRVILNLINNAFYAVSQRQKTEGKEYEPTVIISTAHLNGNVEVKVKDNGIGISAKNLDKIFQPFFTTKPTGQGTGLGLSLSYDIIRAHGGELKVETKENNGSLFAIQLPYR